MKYAAEDGLRYHDIHTKFNKNWFSNRMFVGGDIETHTDSMGIFLADYANKRSLWYCHAFCLCIPDPKCC
jgi:hypothetical protein